MASAAPGVLLGYIASRNREREVWGWKYPTAIASMKTIFFALRNPRIIMVFRDMISSIDAEMRFDDAYNIDPRRTIPALAKQASAWWATNMDFVAEAACPMLLVSYEWAIRTPERFVRELAEFLGITLNHELLQKAMSRINPRGGYLCLDATAAPIPKTQPGD
jgi:hypothetical protein